MRLNSLLVITSLLPLFVFTGCADILRDILGKGKARRTSTVAVEDIRWLTLEDPDCQTSGTSVALKSVTAHLWDGATIKSTVVPFGGITDQSGIFSSAKIYGSILNVELTENCNISSTHEEDCKPASTANANKNVFLKICRTDGSYKRDSLEGMVLTTQFLLEENFKYYDTIAGRKEGIASAYIVAQMKLKKDYKLPDGSSKTLYEADNAAFARSVDESASALFNLYPTSTAEFALSGVNLWEVPFVISHEFAHHVMDLYISGSMAMHGFKPTFHFGAKHHSILPTGHGRPKDLELTGETLAQMAVNGINETFADLYAYFQYGAKTEQLKGVPCLNVSRDPGISLTKGGANKGLTPAQVSIYEGKSAALEFTSCYEATFDDEHDIALALGYPLAQFLRTAVGAADNAGSSKALLLWASRMNTLIESNLGSVSLDTLVRELILAVKTDMSKDIGRACAALKPQITGLPLTSSVCQ